MATAKLIPKNTPIAEAEKIRRTENPRDFPQAILTEEEVMGIEIPNRGMIVEGLIAKETITIINGARGEGKSWLVEQIANEITWGGRVGPWKVIEPVNVLLIDGEMTMRLVKERQGLMNVGRDIRKKPKQLYIYSENYAYRIGLERANILDVEWRKTISEWVHTLDIGFLILDNLSSLAPGIDENDKLEFDPVNRWLLELRFGGVAIGMTHHTGKSGDQRGTSAHEDHVDNALVVTRPKGYKYEMGCRIRVEASKDREQITGGKAPILQLEEVMGAMKFVEVEEGGEEKISKFLAGNPEMGAREAEVAGVSRRQYYKIKKDKKWK